MTLKQKRNSGIPNQSAHCDEVMNFAIYVKLSGSEDACGDEEQRNDVHAF